MQPLPDRESPSPRRPVVKVCVLTYNRPRQLEDCLRALDAQTFPHGAPDLHIAVIDNHPTPMVTPEAVRALVTRFPATVLHQPRPGIATSRNAAIVAAPPLDYDFLAFVDDDEVASPTWVDALMAAQAVSGAAVVAGPVVPILPEDAPAWFRRGGFLQPSEKPDLVPVAGASTGNVLFSRALPDSGIRFEEKLALVLGEDTIFFDDAYRAGFPMVHAAGAIVYENIPRHRATTGWLIRRWMSVGFVERHKLLRRMGRGAAMGHLAFHGVRRFLAGFLTAVPFLVIAPLGGWHIVMKRIHHACRGASMILAIGGLYAGERKR